MPLPIRGESEQLSIFRDAFRRFVRREVVPNLDRYEVQGIVDKTLWRLAGASGFLCPMVPPEYGGAGLDFRYNAIIGEELHYVGATIAFALQSDVVSDYLLAYGNEEQKQRFLPRMARGEIVCAIGMTEPEVGSDVKNLRTIARRDGNFYVINGAKTYITNGQNADLIFLAARTGGEGAHGISMLLVEVPVDGFERGRNLDKIGENMSDTSELFFNDVRVPVTSLLGEEGKGFIYMMSQLAQERLTMAVASQAAAQRAYDEAVAFARGRRAFGQAIIDFQNSRFVLADIKSRLQVGWAHLAWLVDRHVERGLTPEEAAAGKLWHTEQMWDITDAALQLHGGSGYMNEYLIARLWRDARVKRIAGGSSEIMKEVIGRSL